MPSYETRQEEDASPFGQLFCYSEYMRVKAIIEIPRGDDRRRHINKYNKSEFIDLGPMKDHIPVNNGVAPEHYGFIPNTLNRDDGDEVDVLVFSDTKLNVGDTIDVKPIALLKREDNDEKVVAVEVDSTATSWDDLEKSRRDLVLRFFGSHHRIVAVESRDHAEKYILDSMIKELI